MTQVVTTEVAEPGTRFAAGCLDTEIDKEVPLKVNGETIGTSVLLGYSVAEDGSFMTMTFEISDDALAVDLPMVSEADPEADPS